MRAITRLTIAYVAARLITGKEASSVYDYGAGGYTHMSGEVSGSRINVYCRASDLVAGPLCRS